MIDEMAQSSLDDFASDAGLTGVGPGWFLGFYVIIVITLESRTAIRKGKHSKCRARDMAHGGYKQMGCPLPMAHTM